MQVRDPLCNANVTFFVFSAVWFAELAIAFIILAGSYISLLLWRSCCSTAAPQSNGSAIPGTCDPLCTWHDLDAPQLVVVVEPDTGAIAVSLAEHYRSAPGDNELNHYFELFVLLRKV